MNGSVRSIAQWMKRQRLALGATVIVGALGAQGMAHASVHSPVAPPLAPRMLAAAPEPDVAEHVSVRDEQIPVAPAAPPTALTDTPAVEPMPVDSAIATASEAAVAPVAAAQPRTAPLAAAPGGVASGPVAALQAPVRVSPAPAPAAVAQDSAAPVQAVTGFYAAIAQRQPDQALQFWSSRMRGAYPPGVYLYDRFSGTRQMVVRSVRMTSMDAAAGRATVEVELAESSSVPAFNRTWHGTWHLVRSTAGWLLDAPSFRV